MYEEDRLEALAMYEELFDDCSNEQGLLQFLSSPTRQAVVIARAYGGRERKLDVNSQSRGGVDDDNNGTPDFVEAIFKVRDLAEEKGLLAVEDTAEDVENVEEAVVENDEKAEEEAVISNETVEEIEEKPQEAAEETVSEPQEDSLEANPSEEGNAEPAGEPNVEATVEPTVEATEEATEEATVEPTVEAAEEAEPVPAEGFKLPDTQQTEEKKPDEESIDEFIDAQTKEINDFINSFSIENPEYEVKKDETPEPVAEDDVKEEPVKRKTLVLALIGFLILFIPLGLMGVLFFIVLALLFLSAGVGVGAGGVILLSTLAGSFGMFADLLVVAGVSVVALALALLLLWTAIWFIGGACVSMIKGIVSLGRNWCVKEVSAE